MPRTLAQNAEYIANTIKPAIKSAIEAQGVTVPSTDSFLDYADRIGEIEGGGSGYQLKDLPTGAISTVNDAEPLPLNALKVSVEAVQSGSGTPSPSNIRPISGWDSGEIFDNNANFWNIYENWNESFVTALNNEIDITVRSQGGTIAYCLQKLKTYGEFTFSATTNGTYSRLFVRIRKADDSGWATNSDYSIAGWSYNSYYSGWYKEISASGAISTTFTIPKCRYWQMGIGANSATSVGVGNTFTFTNPMLNIGSQSKPYEPYQGEQYTQQFPTTIYGAEWDVVNGSAAEGYGFVEYDGSADENWNLQNFSANSSAYIYINDKKIGFQTSVCNLANNVNGAWGDSQHLAYYSDHPSLTAVYFNRPIDTMPLFFTLQEWRDFLANNPIQLKYELATPTTIDLSPLSIRLLEGTNNLYADCGEVIEGEYFVDEGAHRYQLYDYIESDGTQVIDLGRQVVSGQTVKTVFHPMSDQVAYAWLFGAGDASHYYGFQLPQQTTLLVYNGSTSSSGQMSVNTADEYVYNLVFTASDSLALNYYAFGFNYSETPGGNNKGKFRLYSISIGGDVYLPAKRKSDGVFGLWDVANQIFLTDSAGGNAFVGGNPTGVEV